MPWYELSLSYQNKLRCAISSAQNGAVLKMGPMNEFDFETATYVSIIKCKYVFFMFIGLVSVVLTLKSEFKEL